MLGNCAYCRGALTQATIRSVGEAIVVVQSLFIVLTAYQPGIFIVESDDRLLNQVCVALSGLPWPLRNFEHFGLLVPQLRPDTTGCVVASLEHAGSVMVLRETLDQSPASLSLILLTRDIAIPEAVSAIRAGVDDLIPLPLIERDFRSRVDIMMRRYK